MLLLFEKNACIAPKLFEHKFCFAPKMFEQTPCFAPKMFKQKSCFAPKSLAFLYTHDKMLEQSLALHQKCFNKVLLNPKNV